MRSGKQQARGERLQAAALVGALLVLGAAGSALAPRVRPETGLTTLDGAAWEGRRLFAQMLWLKTHAVLHAGAEERPALAGEEKSRAAEMHRHDGGEQQAGGAGAAGHDEHGDEHDHAAHDHGPGEPGEHAAGHQEPGHEGHGHEEPAGHEAPGGHEGAYVLVIPPAREDFRGFLGDLERAVKPYAGTDGKLYEKDQDQTIPFYRLMTWADPHFIQGYTVGANFICRSGKDVPGAIAFLKEGERLNPRSFEIQTELGHYYLVYVKDYATADRHLRRGLELLPRGRKLTPMEEDERIDLFRWAALNYTRWGKPREAVQIAREGVRTLGPDITLDLVLLRQGQP